MSSPNGHHIWLDGSIITSSTSSSTSNGHNVDRVKLLYRDINEDETPLPRCWSTSEKCQSIELSQNNRRAFFKGKEDNDAAAVRTDHPIPVKSGVYYFEVKIISKGENGQIGIGFTSQQFRMNRLPGWDKQSYGYHGDDGNLYDSSGHGHRYGPTFTTGDIIGCGVNCGIGSGFYTKNGAELNMAFRELPTLLYPTVGFQTTGAEVEVNFGQERFVYSKVEEMIHGME